MMNSIIFEKEITLMFITKQSWQWWRRLVS